MDDGREECVIQPMDTGRRGRKYYVSNVKQSTPFVYSKAGRAIPLFSTSATRKPKQSLEPRQSLVEQGKMWHTPHLLRIYDRLKRIPSTLQTPSSFLDLSGVIVLEYGVYYIIYTQQSMNILDVVVDT